MMFSTSSPTYPASVNVVASTMAKGTSSMRESVCARSVLPVPVGPIKRMLDFVNSTSPGWRLRKMRFSSSRICWQTPTHSLQMYERGYSDGELMSFSTCSCVLWQKEQRNGSSGVNRFTDSAPSRRNPTHEESGTHCKTEASP